MQRVVPELWFEPTPWIAGKSIAKCLTQQVINPATGELLSKVAWADPQDMDDAIRSAQEAQATWQSISPFERGDILKRIAGNLEVERDRFARLLTAEQGKPYAQALGEVDYAASFFRWFGEEARRICGRIAPHSQSDREYLIEHRPVGVAAWITPWNFPLAQGAKKIAAALAAGCCGIWKPAESTPLIALAMASVFEQSGVPAGVIQITPGLGSELGPILCEHPAVRVVSLTGSAKTGRSILAKSASSIKRVHLELGGNAPFIVLPDADLDLAVDHLVRLKLFVSGQVCVTANRIFVHEDIHDRFCDKLVKRLGQATLGDGLQDGVDAGPLIHAQACQGVDRLVQQACQQGANILYRNESYHQDSRLVNGSFYPATVLVDLSDKVPLFGCEIFGPVFPIFRYREIGEVIRRSNGVEQGLAGYVYGSDLSQCRRIARQLEVGIVGVNEWRPLKAEIPFGGIKQSGLGVEGGKEGMDDYLSLQVISVPKD
ncbi:MAG: NAD-dependent succinate-semialdehyde dehydrogenase [Pirellula sp.]